jgi:hypothetical protein
MTTHDDEHRAEVIARLNRELDVALRLAGQMAVLTSECLVCYADPGNTCRWMNWTEWVCLDPVHQIYSHIDRCKRAVESGVADRDIFAAMFGAYPPVWVQQLRGPADVTEDHEERL